MACAVCQHCQEPLTKDGGFAVRDGYSYHNKCHKCYVCSETDLLNAEVFNGVIFCRGCSQRIFQGCSTARKTKNGNRSKSGRSKNKKRRERVRTQERRPETARPTHGVLELARLAASSDSGSSNYREKNRSRLSNALEMSTELAQQIGKITYENNSKDLKKNSTEMGMTTEVTQELLRQMNCPTVAERKKGSKPTSPLAPKDKGDNRYNKTIICSDLRIAELGASTEIAHMALRKQSEVPVIMKPEGVKVMASLNLSRLNQESDESADDNDEWLESSYSMKRRSDKGRWLDRRIGSILKMPYKCFKRNILDRSSLITLLASNESSSYYFLKRLRVLFHQEIAEHQERGIKRLYSTINRRKTPYKMGWLKLMERMSTVMSEISIRERIEHPKRCKHFKRSHSYRCMRAQVMKLAGPTKGELASFRHKILRIFAPKFLKNIFGFNRKCLAITMSKACGSDVREASLRNAKSN